MKRTMDRTGKNRARRRTRSERGAALIFTLGMLGIITMLALIFASNAITERKVAAANCNASGAKMLARSALERVVAAANAMAAGEADFSALQVDKLYSCIGADNSSADWLWKLEKSGYFQYPDSSTPGENSHPQWQLVQNPFSSDHEIIGRFAYVSVAGGTTIDPRAVADKVYQPDTDYTSGNRPGISTTELDLSAIPQVNDMGDCTGAASIKADDVKLSGKDEASTTSIINGWIDLDTVIHDSNINATGDEANALRKFFYWRSAKLNETYTATEQTPDPGGGDPTETEKQYHRFNLNKSEADWNVFANGTDVNFAKLSNSLEFQEGVTPSATDAGLPFFGDHASSVKVKQTAANFVQYNLPQNTVSLSDSSDWAVSAPSYNGLKRSAYINEVGIRLNATLEILYERLDNGTGAYDEKYTYNINVAPSIGVELIRIYETVPTHCKLYLEGTCSFSVQVADGAATKVESDLSNFEIVPATDSIGSNGYTTSDKFWTHGSTDGTAKLKAYALSNYTVTNPTSASVKISDVQLAVKRVYLADSTDGSTYVNSDYAKLPEDSGAASMQEIQMNAPASEGTEITYWGGARGWEVEDPRQNLREEDWTELDKEELTQRTSADFDTIYKGSPGQINTKANANPSGRSDCDPETVTNPAWIDSSQHLSTAYIRHAPMESPWEMGFIHRGEKWKTLNLKKAKKVASPEDLTMNDDYADGDGHIYDQIKMTDEISVWDKVNLRGSALCSACGRPNHMLHALLYKIPSYSTPEFPASPGADYLLDDSAIRTVAEAICNAANDTNVQRRSDILAYSGGSGTAPFVSSLGSTDAEQEQLVGRIINLTKVAPADSATVLILAQTITDAGGAELWKDWDRKGSPSAPSTPAALYEAGYLRPGESTPFADGHSGLDHITTTIGTYDVGGDQITGEAKLMVTLEFDPANNKWKIVRYEYTD